MPDLISSEVRAVVADASSFRTRALSVGHASLALLILAAIAYCTWILTLPVFPTQDGSIHLFYVRILEALLLHQAPGIFPQYYTIKHLLPPYSIYYYMLLGLSRFVPLLVADKLVICLYVLSFLFGFRFLARSLGPRGDSMALLAAPLVLNWPLGMGFVNFCLSASFSFWALGLWCRAVSQPWGSQNRLRLGGFVALCFLIMMTHPVPLLVLLGFCVVDLAIRIVRARRRADVAGAEADGALMRPRANLVRQAIALTLALTTLLYVLMFTTHNPVHQVEAGQGTYFQALRGHAGHLLSLQGLVAFTPRFGVLSSLYRLLILFILLVPLGMAVGHLRRSLRAGLWAMSDTWTVLGVLLLIALPLLPPDLNSSHYFSERLVLLAWLAMLAAASGTGSVQNFSMPVRGPAWNRSSAGLPVAIACYATLTTVLALVLAVQRINPVAARIAASERMPLGATHQVSLLLLDPMYRAGQGLLTYDPFYWMGTRYLRRTDSVLYNTPWLELPILPLGARPIMPTGKLSISALEWTAAMRQKLASSAEARRLIFEHVDTVVLNRGTATFHDDPDPVLALDPVPGHHWGCSPDGMFTVCTLRPR